MVAGSCGSYSPRYSHRNGRARKQPHGGHAGVEVGGVVEEVGHLGGVGRVAENLRCLGVQVKVMRLLQEVH